MSTKAKKQTGKKASPKAQPSTSSIKIAGDANVIGHHNKVSVVKIKKTGDSVASGQREELIALMQNLLKRVETLELEAWEREEVAGNLRTAKKMAQAKEPPKEKLVDKLTATQKLLEAVKGTATAAVGLAPFLQQLGQAVVWARQWLNVP